MLMDPLLAFGIAILSGAGFAAAVLVALATLALYRKIPRVSGWVAAGFLGVFVAAMLATPPGYDPDEIARVDRLRAGFAPTLEGYRARHGHYPLTLEAAEIPTPDTRYGPVRYFAKVDEQGRPKYSLSVGDYDLNGFESWWDTGRPPGDWYLNM